MTQPYPPKAQAVTVDGLPDPRAVPRGFRAQVAPDGGTRLVVNVPGEELSAIHLRLLWALSAPVSVRYVRLTDRRGQGALPKPQSFVGMDLPLDRIDAALRAHAALVWHDGRHQLWLRGALGEQVVLDELGVLYLYPDDPAFRDALVGVPEGTAVGLDGRDYVKVTFLAEADVEEDGFIAALSLQEWPPRAAGGATQA